MWWCNPKRIHPPGAALRVALLSTLLTPLLVTLLPGCSGYRVMRGDVTRVEGVTLVVEAFQNQTAEPFLASPVSNSIRERLLAAGVQVVTGGAPTLRGRIVGFGDDILAYDTAGTARERRVVLTVVVDLEGETGPLWSGRRLVGVAEYPVTGDATLNRDRKDRAIAEAAFDLAEALLLELPADDETTGGTPGGTADETGHRGGTP